MTYEMDGIKVNCAEGISKEEAAVYLKDQLQVRPHETLLSSTLPRFNDAKKAEVADRVCHLH